MPPGHVGPVVLPGGRLVYWTGRVAIGLRHQVRRPVDQPLPESHRCIQRLLLAAPATPHRRAA